MNEFSSSVIKSDTLSTLRSMFEENQTLKTLGSIFKIALIIDANIVIRDILWLVRKRTSPDARTEFLEVLNSGTIIAIAPTFLKDEIRLNLCEVAIEHGLLLDKLEAHWKVYEELIEFVDVGGPDDRYEDPKDAPYLKLQEKLGHLILSKDSDISRMGGKVASASLVARLRKYARHAAIEYTLKAGGFGSITISYITLRALGRILKSLRLQAKKIPKWIWFSVLLMAIGSLLYPPMREFVLKTIRPLANQSKNLGAALLDALETFSNSHSKAKVRADIVLAEIRNEIEGLSSQS